MKRSIEGGASAGLKAARPGTISPLCVRVAAWIVLVVIALLAIAVIDRHAMTLQSRVQQSVGDAQNSDPAAARSP